MERVPGIPTRVMELIGQLQIEKNKYNLAAIISELEDIGAMANHAVPYLYSIAHHWKGFQLAEQAKKAANKIVQAALKEKEAKEQYHHTKSTVQSENDSFMPLSKKEIPKVAKSDISGSVQKKRSHNVYSRKSFHDVVKEVVSGIENQLKRVIRNDIWEEASFIKNNPEEVPSKIWKTIKLWIAPNKLWQLLVTLSIITPLLSFVFPLSFSLPFWGSWILIFYGTIWSFGYFNRNYCKLNSPFQGIRVPKGLFLNRNFFLSWLLLEAILFAFVIWFRLVKNLTVILILFFGIFGIFGLVYGLADVTCPHCGAINSGIKYGDGDNTINYRCCVCKKSFSHRSGMN